MKIIKESNERRCRKDSYKDNDEDENKRVMEEVKKTVTKISSRMKTIYIESNERRDGK